MDRVQVATQSPFRAHPPVVPPPVAATVETKSSSALSTGPPVLEFRRLLRSPEKDHKWPPTEKINEWMMSQHEKGEKIDIINIQMNDDDWESVMIWFTRSRRSNEMV
jgi:hypothetical protein